MPGDASQHGMWTLQPLDINQHLRAPVAADRMTKSVADQHDATAVALGDIKIDRPDLNDAGDGEVAHHFVKLPPKGNERLARLVAKLLQPWIADPGRRTCWRASCRRSEQLMYAIRPAARSVK